MYKKKFKKRNEKAITGKDVRKSKKKYKARRIKKTKIKNYFLIFTKNHHLTQAISFSENISPQPQIHIGTNLIFTNYPLIA